MGTDHKLARRDAASMTAAPGREITRPAIVEQTQLGNAALLEMLGKQPGSGAMGGMTSALGGTTGSGPGSDDEKKKKDVRTALFATGWGADTLQGGRFNSRNADPTLGGFAGDASRFATTGGKGNASDDKDTAPIAYPDTSGGSSTDSGPKTSTGDSAGTSSGAASSTTMGASTKADYTVKTEGNKVLAPITTKSRPTEDAAGSGQVGPNPLAKGRDPARGMVAKRKTAGGPGEGRGETGAPSAGPGLFDGKNIMAKSGGAVGKEAKEPDSSAIAMEVALKQAFFTDPKRG